MNSINILGLGIMGLQLAALLNILGYKISVYNRSVNDTHKKKLSIQTKILQRSLSKNNQEKIIFTTNINDLQEAITIEALAEDLTIKREVIMGLSYDVTKSGLFTNSSSLEPKEIHDSAYALHFFNPIYTIKLVETTCPLKLQESIYLNLFSSLKESGFNIVNVISNRGYIGNYILFREIALVLNMADKFNYAPKKINKIQQFLGRSASIFDIVDQVGVDVTKIIIENLKEQDPSIIIPTILDKALKIGILGKKNKTSILSMYSEE